MKKYYKVEIEIVTVQEDVIQTSLIDLEDCFGDEVIGGFE